MKFVTTLLTALVAACLLPAAPAAAEYQPDPPDVDLLGAAKVEDYCVIVYSSDGSRAEIVCVPYGDIDRRVPAQLPG